MNLHLVPSAYRGTALLPRALRIACLSGSRERCKIASMSSSTSQPVDNEQASEATKGVRRAISSDLEGHA